MKRILIGLVTIALIIVIGSVIQSNAAASARQHSTGHSSGHTTGTDQSLAGQVKSISGTTISISTPKGTASILTGASTTFTVNGKSGSLADITAGMFVHATGTSSASGSLTATQDRRA